MRVRHRYAFKKYHEFRTPTGKGITVLEPCVRSHETGEATGACTSVRVTTYSEGRERDQRLVDASDLAEWVKL
ncbi:MAG: hypothetical protein J4G14_13730 [Dehalococcoidia bacterium]|nr:hypothetical protein [Dehalococcoidia bacterium]